MGKAKRRGRSGRLGFEDQLAIWLVMHFPELEGKPEDIDKLSCEGCEDLKMRVCPGRGLSGENVIRECMGILAALRSYRRKAVNRPVGPEARNRRNAV